MKRYKLTLRSSSRDGYFLYLTFDKPKDLSYMDGQYGVFLHVDKDVEGRKMRAFSFASSMEEDVVIVGTRVTEPVSSFKQHMLALSPGDTMTVDGPMGKFTLEVDHPKVFLAGGIGITPIRSMIQGMNDKDGATLVFSELNEHYPMLDDVSQPNIDIHLVSGVESTQEQIERVAKAQSEETYYYIAGSHGFVNGVNQQLQDLGVAKKWIKYDRFTGY